MQLLTDRQCKCGNADSEHFAACMCTTVWLSISTQHWNEVAQSGQRNALLRCFKVTRL